MELAFFIVIAFIALILLIIGIGMLLVKLGRLELDDPCDWHTQNIMTCNKCGALLFGDFEQEKGYCYDCYEEINE
jgi:hypothetical protein